MLASFLLFSLTAATAGPRERAAALEADRGSSEGLILVLEDQSGRLENRPAVTLNSERFQQRVALVDGGEQPDKTAGDKVYTAWINPAPQAAEMQVALLDGDTPLWQDTAPLVGASPTIRMVLTPDDVLVVFDVPEPEPPQDGPPPPGAPGDGPAPDGDGESPVALAVLSGTVGAVLGALGVAGVAWRRRQAASTLGPVGTPAPHHLPGLPSGSLVLGVPDSLDPHGVARALALRGAACGPVLVLPDPATRDRWSAAIAGKPGLCWLPRDRPMASRVAAAVRSLGGPRPVTLLIEGPGALEEPLEGEPVDAVYKEVLEEVRGAATVVLVAPAAAALPDALVLERAEEGLRGPAGTVVPDAELLSAPASKEPS